MDNIELENSIVDALKTVYDPEIPVDVFELGLIYEVKIDENQAVEIVMTLTTPNCPVAEELPQEVKEKAEEVEGVKSVYVNLLFEPPWEMSMMSEEAKLELGFL